MFYGNIPEFGNNVKVGNEKFLLVLTQPSNPLQKSLIIEINVLFGMMRPTLGIGWIYKSLLYDTGN